MGEAVEIPRSSGSPQPGCEFCKQVAEAVVTAGAVFTCGVHGYTRNWRDELLPPEASHGTA